MANIQSIKRDQAYSPFIVRIVSEDSLAAVGTANYLVAQAAVIAALNEGPFEWEVSDMILVYASDGWGFFQIDPDFKSLVPFAFSDAVVGTPVVVGDFAVFQSTSGNLEDLGYLPRMLPKLLWSWQEAQWSQTTLHCSRIHLEQSMTQLQPQSTMAVCKPGCLAQREH